MEMKDIDLMKCNSLRYRAKVDGNNDYGRICVENVASGVAFLWSERDNGYVALWSCVYPIVLGIGERKVTDFELVPRDPETYQDWHVGDLIGNADGSSGRIIFRSGEFVVADIDGCRCRTCRELFDEGYRLMLTDIEDQILGERKKYEPQDGDVVYAKVSHNDNDAIFIYKKAVENRIYGYAGYNIGYDRMVDTHGFAYITPNIIGDLIEYRPATEEEKQMLFDAMAKKGMRWNAEKKVVEDIPKPHEFKKGEPVLVRTDYGRDWVVAVYVENSSNPEAQFGKYGATDGRSIIFYRFCLPYNERTMHLLGTSEDYKEE